MQAGLRFRFHTCKTRFAMCCDITIRSLVNIVDGQLIETIDTVEDMIHEYK